MAWSVTASGLFPVLTWCAVATSTISLASSSVLGMDSLLLDAIAPDFVSGGQRIAIALTPAPAIQDLLANLLGAVVTVDTLGPLDAVGLGQLGHASRLIRATYVLFEIAEAA